MDYHSIGRKIRDARKAKNLRQEDLAEQTGLSVKYIGMLERGEKMPALETLVKIANCLGVSSDMLLCEVLNMGYKVKDSQFAEKIEGLPKAEKDRIYDVVDILIRHAKNEQSLS